MDKLKSLERLEEALARLPSVGKRSAERMAYAMLNFSDEDLFRSTKNKTIAVIITIEDIKIIAIITMFFLLSF